jgi:hypothetical protein
MGLEKGSANFRWVLFRLLASAAVIEFQISNLSLSKLKYNIDQESTEEKEKTAVGNISRKVAA